MKTGARSFWLLVGLLAVASGIVGVALPLVPTTPFLLLAVFAFARSSPRLHDWLIQHPRFGPPIENWRRHGAIGRRAKAYALVAIVATPLVSLALGVKPWVLAVQALVLAAVAVFILTRPSGPRVGLLHAPKDS